MTTIPTPDLDQEIADLECALQALIADQGRVRLEEPLLGLRGLAIQTLRLYLSEIKKRVRSSAPTGT
jgi:hypothetical protein